MQGFQQGIFIVSPDILVDKLEKCGLDDKTLR